MINQHALLPLAADLAGADARLAPQLTPETLRVILAMVPDVWLTSEEGFAGPDELRAAYVDYLQQRLAASTIFVEEAANARAKLL